MKGKQQFSCSVCGTLHTRWQGQCMACGEWNSLVSSSQNFSSKISFSEQPTKSPTLLENLPSESTCNISIGNPALDALFGSGLVPGSAILLGGDPGIGKSTFLLQLVAFLIKRGHSGVYVSGEESAAQLKRRAERLDLLGNGFPSLCTTRLEDVLFLLEQKPAPDVLVVDSVQTLISSTNEGLSGSPGQVRTVSGYLVEAAKESGTILILVGHVTKEGQIAGPKLLEHMVDTVLYLEGDQHYFHRILRVIKNRFGSANEVLLMQMSDKGLSVVRDPSTFFLQDRDPSLSGTALVMSLEGQRAFAVEVQALGSKSFLSMPRRTALGFDANRLHLLLAVMGKKLYLNLGQKDIYAKIGAGLRLQEPGLDLGLVAAVLSSCHERPLPPKAVFWGEVDLSGQVRPVLGHEIRLKQARRLGYEPIICPVKEDGVSFCPNIEVLQDMLFTKG